MTPDILLQMKKVWNKDPSKFDNIMLWAACCLCYFGFLRSSEITVPSDSTYDKAVHLNMEDLAVDNVANPSVIKVTIKASKTDQFRGSQHLHWSNSQWTVSSSSDPGICSVQRKSQWFSFQVRRRPFAVQRSIHIKSEIGSVRGRNRFVIIFQTQLQNRCCDHCRKEGSIFREK